MFIIQAADEQGFCRGYTGLQVLFTDLTVQVMPNIVKVPLSQDKRFFLFAVPLLFM